MSHTAPPLASVEGYFQLLMPAAGPAPSGARSVDLQGRHWILTDQQAPDAKDTPPYICVSYAWGPTWETPNPFYDGQTISDRTLPALEAATRALSAIEVEPGEQRPTAVWLDAACIPVHAQARTACLRNMGAIYAHASHVVVRLSPQSSMLLEQIHDNGEVNSTALLVLNEDDWVSRAWTYQEIVNSRSMYFVAEGAGNVVVHGNKFLNSVGDAIKNFRNERGYDWFDLRKYYPQLHSVEDVLADWLAADYVERSAYQVMSAMHGRQMSGQTGNLFDAMIGALTTAQLQAPDALPMHPAEYFMQLCEAKEDLSFIYSSALRDNARGNCWRPAPGPLPALLPWHSFGERQSGHVHPTHVQLDNMCRMILGNPDAATGQAIDELFPSSDRDASSGDDVARILRRLEAAGFTGCGEYLELERGYFFPQEPLPNMDGVRVIVSTEVRWAFGAPGLLVRDNRSGMFHFAGVGVCVGIIPEGGESINIERTAWTSLAITS